MKAVHVESLDELGSGDLVVIKTKEGRIVAGEVSVRKDGKCINDDDGYLEVWLNEAEEIIWILDL